MTRIFSSACRGSTSRFIAKSTVSSNFVNLNSRTISNASGKGYDFILSYRSVIVFIFLDRLIYLSLPFDFNAHGNTSSFDHQHGLFNCIGIQIWHFHFRDRTNICFSDSPNLFLIGFAGPFFNLCSFQD